MADTYTQLYVQIVFAVKGRQNLIHENLRDVQEKYMCGIISNNKSKLLAIYCNPDHTHILLGLHPEISVSEITGDIKASSSKWINENKKIKGKFSWQAGYGAFTYSKSQIGRVSDYILNQPKHHKKRSFKEEYLDMLNKFEIEYKDAYLFEWIE
jgi:REP element-mobilizing transposase RayT